MSNPIYTGVFTSHQQLPAAQLDALVLAINNHDHGTEAGGGSPLSPSAIIPVAYPVGSLYFNASVATNPATLLGYGTWVAFGVGRVIVGFQSGDPTFGTAGATGGEKTHTLTIPEIPAHTHGISDETGVQGGTPEWSANSGSARQSGSTGGGGAHNNLQPYIVVYAWVRTL